MSLVSAAIQVTDLGWRQTIRSKLLIGIGILLVFSVVIASVIHNAQQNPKPVTDTQAIQAIILSAVVVPLISLLLGTNALAAEREGGTLSYLFTRPFPRAAVVIGKGVAAIAVGVAATIVTTLAVWIANGAPDSGIGGAIVALSLESIALTSVFVLIGTVLARSLYAGLAYVVLFEGFLGNLLVRNGPFSIGYHARNLLSEWSGSAFTAVDGDAPLTPLPTSATESILVMTVVTVVVLALACLWVETQEYGLRDRPKEE